MIANDALDRVNDVLAGTRLADAHRWIDEDEGEIVVDWHKPGAAVTLTCAAPYRTLCLAGSWRVGDRYENREMECELDADAKAKVQEWLRAALEAR